jgi:lipopolysaccharide transport system permease protein
MNKNKNKGKVITVIEPGQSKTRYWKDVWDFRELFYILSWRDIKVRYKQTVIGILWSVVRPLITMLVFTFVFGGIADLPSKGTAPYAVMVYAAMLPWQFFANSLSESSNSLVGNSSLISKVYFPRLIIPSSTILTSLIDFLISFTILGALFVYFQYIPSWRILLVPLFLFIALLCSLGIGYLFASLNVKYRDFRYIVPFIIQFGLYISPVGFSSDVIPEKYQAIYQLNPMVGIIEGFRWCILDENISLDSMPIILSIIISLFLFWLGINRFKKMEKGFADII